MSYDPYALAFPAAPFTLSSKDFEPGGALPASAYATADGPGESPELSWGPLPAGTRSLVVTAFDADAPIPGGLWHWVVKDIPATVPGLAHGAGAGLPPGAVHLVNDLGAAAWSGVKPPPGTGTHRLVVCATALSVASLDVPAGASLAMLNILLIPHTVGRAVLVGTSTAGV
ncbi:YbhB/YbcL family Raf kinase inhibitor-like protein [Actinoplanes sp. NPDC051494]|uniref:YbhB/YbcL family Raf kinase inhibitor-like protein n=1 Tax=Actinoplanes sp. NPDC051494 TaxID=3363907 RepID=UPI00379C498C